MRSELEIAHKALDIGRARFAHGPRHIYTKSERDLVSDTDLTIERELRRFLAEQTPQFGFFGEEEGWSDKLNQGSFWVLDPVDGTSNFVRDLPLCGISLALVENGQTVVGAIDLPFLGERYSAIENQGAQKGEKAISISENSSKLEDAMIAIGDFAVGRDAQAKNRPRLAIVNELAKNAHRVRMLGSAAVDLAWVAEGRLDGIIMLSNKPWDTAAGVLIAREAGACVMDTSGEPHNLRSKSTVVTTPQLAQFLLALIEASIDF